MEKKGVSRYAVELGQASFGETPKALDAIDVVLAHGKLMRLVVHPKMFLISHIDQAVVATPTVGVDDRLEADTPQNGLAERLPPAVGNDLGIDISVALEDAKHDGLASCATASFAPNPTRAEVALIDFDFSSKGILRLTPASHLATQFEVDRVHLAYRKTGYGGRFTGRQIESENANQTSKKLLRNMGTDVILVLARRHWRSAILQVA